MKILNCIIILFLLFSATACKGKKKEQRPLTKEEEATLVCVKENLHKSTQEYLVIDKQIIAGMIAGESTIPLIIEKRRLKEECCLEHARCFGDNDRVLGSMFRECLKDDKEDI